MDSKEQSQQQSEEKLTFTIRTSTKNRIMAKLIIFLFLTGCFNYFFSQQAAKEYEKGKELTVQEYLENFDEYKSDLIASKNYTNQPALTFFVSLIVVSFLIGSYELMALIIGFIIGKLIKQ